MENLDEVVDRMKDVVKKQPKITAGELRAMHPDFQKAIDWLRNKVKN